MLPDIRAVIAAMAAAIGLLMIGSGVVATWRVAQESRAGSLHADVAQRGRTTVPEPRPVVVIETPGPTLLAKAPEVEPLGPADAQVPSSAELPAMKSEQAPQLVASIPETPPPPTAAAPAAPDPDREPAAAITPAMESPALAAMEPAPEPPSASMIAAAAPDIVAAQPEPPSPPSAIAAMGGPSAEEIEQAKAQRKAAQRALAHKAAAEKKKKARAARIARERKLAAQRAEAQKQQASAANPQSGFGFAPSGPFNSAPFSNSFGGAINRR